jgi:hypothetical protein
MLSLVQLGGGVGCARPALYATHAVPSGPKAMKALLRTAYVCSARPRGEFTRVGAMGRKNFFKAHSLRLEASRAARSSGKKSMLGVNSRQRWGIENGFSRVAR